MYNQFNKKDEVIEVNSNIKNDKISEEKSKEEKSEMKNNKYAKLAEKLSKPKKVNISFKIDEDKKEILSKYFEKSDINQGDFFMNLIDWKQMEEYIK